ncbi:pentatricopeptide repeat-containing protein DOT4, chloroplastic-like [Arachis duranensis]|uniref:Pentatricopeptide repeat-containing protein DOT4, chloroplastic-like n=1 Tax=Arachis duranensis TaxID=130453 RepID=A0A6P4CUU9_ARADU|nr:pentatricopeptide repeat-containing protein DOT4, chloroplastic-like [Arachis duranensis]
MRVWPLRSQRAFSFLPSPPTQTSITLQACSSSKSLTKAKQIHQQIIINGTHRNPFFATKLIQLYIDCDDISSALFLLHHLHPPNVFAFTSILRFYSRHGQMRQCIRTYVDLRVMGVVPDGYVFPKVLKACAQSQWFETGVAVHKDVITFGSESNLQACNAVLDMYSKCADVQSAQKVFNEMSERDVFSWNSMMSGYVSNGLFEEAVRLLGLMRASGDCEPDVVTWNTMMDAYCKMGRCSEALRVFHQIKDPNVISWTTLISGYAGVRRHDLALGTFRDMVNFGMVLPDVDSLSGILVSCRFLGSLTSGNEVHCYGVKVISGDAFYKSAGAALLTLYANCGRLNDAENVFDRMDKSDVVTWNAMIYGLIDMGLANEAVQCFKEMQASNVKVDQTTVSTLLLACDLRRGKEMHAYVLKHRYNWVIPVCNALIHTYSKCGCIAYAYSVFSTMAVRDLVSWNTIISGFGMHGLGQTVLKLLQEMRDAGISPDSVTFSSALSACSHSGLVNEGIELFYRMIEEFSLNPAKEHFSCVVDMLARAGRLEDAFHFINKMPLEPDKHVWGALLAACQEHQNVSVGKLAAEKLIDLEPQEAGHYVTLSNIYSKAGRWNDAARIHQKSITKHYNVVFSCSLRKCCKEHLGVR